MKPDSFKDKVVVITGASGGVGRATAWEFAKQGAKIALLARGTEQLAGAKREVEQHGGTALVIHAKADDQKSDPATAGDRIACGVIAKQ